jgi:hypothetical protein
MQFLAADLQPLKNIVKIGWIEVQTFVLEGRHKVANFKEEFRRMRGCSEKMAPW